MWTQAPAMHEFPAENTLGHIAVRREGLYYLGGPLNLGAGEATTVGITVLYARNDHNSELLPERAWRVKNWSQDFKTIQDQIETLPTHRNLRRRIFESFLALVKPTTPRKKDTDFMRVLKDGMQLAPGTGSPDRRACRPRTFTFPTTSSNL